MTLAMLPLVVLIPRSVRKNQTKLSLLYSLVFVALVSARNQLN